MRVLEVLRGRELEVTGVRAALALLAGSVAGSAANVAGYLAMSPQDAGNFDIATAWWAAPGAILLFMVVWLPAVFALGGGLWWPLHAIKLRGWPVAVAVGATVPTACVFPIMQADQVPRLYMWAAAYAIAGALCGFTVWRVAYRKARRVESEVFA